MDERIADLAQLFRHAAVAHHEAYSATDGADPDWPLWYADYLYDKLPEHLNRTIGKEELVDELIRLDEAVKSGGGGEDWAIYYAEQFLKQAN